MAAVFQPQRSVKIIKGFFAFKEFELILGGSLCLLFSPAANPGQITHVKDFEG